MVDKIITTGMIGAGAIAQHTYLPILKNISGLKLKAVVEPEYRIRAELADRYPLAYFGDNLDTALEHVEAVIICVPNFLHYPIAMRCIEKGKHVLCEKPMCTKAKDGDDLLKMANDRSVVFTVGHIRRFYPAVQRIRDIIRSNSLGVLKSFDFREGTVFSWPTVSGYIFDKEKAGGGVLMDIGVHLLDLLFWWIDQDVSSFQYADDNLGGVEATAEIRLTFRNGITGQIKVTRLAVLNNSYQFHFEKGDLFWNPFIPHRFYVQEKEGKMVAKTIRTGHPARALLADFSSAIRDKKAPFIKGEEALRAIRLIEACYGSRQSLPMPWLRGAVPNES